MSPRESGLQPERTALAWQRTGLSAAVVAVLLLRTGARGGSPFGLAAAGCALAVMVTAWLMGRRSSARHAPRRVLLGTAVVACAAGALAVTELLSEWK